MRIGPKQVLSPLPGRAASEQDRASKIRSDAAFLSLYDSKPAVRLRGGRLARKRPISGTPRQPVQKLAKPRFVLKTLVRGGGSGVCFRAGERQAHRVVRSVTSHYEIIEKIGEGGYGTVYKAKDLHVPRFVALKFLFAELLNSQRAVQRFREEAKAISALSHPNIVVLHDFDTDPDTGRSFLVLEYLGGGTLRELILRTSKQGLPFHPFELCRCATAIAAGLAHAHRHGITHRDVKSSNVMFSDERIVKITDFGVAKSDGRLDLTEPGFTPGTACYMSPEQARGMDVDNRTDVFSLGIVLYEMATGRLPFSAPSAYEVLHKIVTEPTPTLRESCADLPEELDHIIQRATAKRPDDRYQRMEDLETDLLILQDKLKSASEQPTEALTRLPKRAEAPPRRRFRAIGAAVLALVVVLGVVWLRGRQWRAVAPAPAARLLAVVPFDCLGKEDAQKAFCEGLADTVSMKLTQMEPLQDRVLVIPYSEIRREGVTTATDANRLFKAQLAVTGSVQFLDQTVRIIINLVDAEKKVQTNARQVDSALGSLARLQDDTSTAAAGMLELQLTPANRRQLDAGQTKNEAAFDSYVRGLGFLRASMDIEDVRRATALLEQAVRLDRSYALAHAQLAQAYLRQFRETEDGKWIDRASESCSSALRINADLADAHITMAEIQLARTAPEKAIEELKIALRMDPKSAAALRALGNAYADLSIRTRDPRRKEQAIGMFKQAIALRPELWLGYHDLGLFYLRSGEKARAEEQFRRMLELTDSAYAYAEMGALYQFMDRPDDAIAYLKKSIAIRPTPTAYSNLGTLYYYTKRYSEVIPAMENAVKLSEAGRTRNHMIWGNFAMLAAKIPGMEAKARSALDEAIRIAEAKLRSSPEDAGTHASLAYYLVRAGDSAGAVRHAEEAMALAPDVGAVLFRCALVYERVKQRDKALAVLKQAIEKGHPMKQVLNAGDLAALREDARFKELLKSSK